MMMSLRWQAAVRRLNGRNVHFSPATSTSFAAQQLRQRTATFGLHVASGRAHMCSFSSRVSIFVQEKRSVPSRPYSNVDKNDISPVDPSPKVLQSRFPTKTVVLLVLVSTAVYFLADIKYGDDWVSGIRDAMGDTPFPLMRPLHFYGSPEDVDYWFQHDAPEADFSLRVQDPGMEKALREKFAHIANGWEMNDDDARVARIPVTHGCRFRSNEPCEDYFAIGTAPGPGSKPWNYWSIFDGHAGRWTALKLHILLHPTLSRALSSLPATASSSVINTTIKTVFTTLDNDIMNAARNAANWYPPAHAAALAILPPALSGSCALVAAFDPEQSKLRVACTGDSRAVLGRWDAAEGKYVAHALSVDQTGFNPSEVARLQALHPDEPSLIDPATGRLLGLAVTRAFGDHRWKWPTELVKACELKFFGPAPRPHSKTPPYLTAEPEITETDIIRVDKPPPSNPSSPPEEQTKSDFLILASDGLWDHMSSSVAVSCISSWLDARAGSPPSPSPSPIPDADADADAEQEQDKPLTWQASERYFSISASDNAAVCLTRNALGGNRSVLFSGLVSLFLSTSRMAHDDITVMVVFFDRVGEDQEDNKERKKRWWWPL